MLAAAAAAAEEEQVLHYDPSFVRLAVKTQKKTEHKQIPVFFDDDDDDAQSDDNE